MASRANRALVRASPQVSGLRDIPTQADYLVSLGALSLITLSVDMPARAKERGEQHVSVLADHVR
jgi:hypothetical protein